MKKWGTNRLDARPDSQKRSFTRTSCQATSSRALRIFEKSVSSFSKTFVASRGWFDILKSQFSLHNVSFAGEKASADQEAAAFNFCENESFDQKERLFIRSNL